MKKNEKIAIGASVATLAGVAAGALWQGLTVKRYVLFSDKLSSPVRFAHLSDLHSSVYGKDQQKLIEAVFMEAPDAVLYTGDMVDDRFDPAPAFSLMAALSELFPSYYVTGNHEFYGGRVDDIKTALSTLCKVRVLCGESDILDIRGERISVSGIDDHKIGRREWLRASKRLSVEEDTFNILLSHRPDLVPLYNEVGADLTLCGHAHGGQMMIPGVINGVWAPHQGFFPRYAGGLYHLDKGDMIVSRGLSRNMIPRIFNPPELVTIDVFPKVNDK